jgi:hypothetical protein
LPYKSLRTDEVSDFITDNSGTLKFVYVSGMLMCTIGAEVINTPLNNSAVFVKDKNVILTSDYWRIIVNFDLSSYEDAITILREHLSRVNEIANRSAPIGELQQVETTLNSLENKLGGLKEFLPKARRKRGLINLVGKVSKVLFGTATEQDVDDLASIINVLHSNEHAIVHSVNNQVTYLNRLGGAVKFNYEAIANLTANLEIIALNAQEGFQEVASTIKRNNKKIEAASVIQKLELELTQFEISIDEIVDAIQYVHLGRTPLNFVSPHTLLELLKNVTSVLPKGYELIAGLQPNNVYLYYEVIEAIMLADVHSFKLVLNVPLKTVNRQYELYKIVVLPTRILNNTFAQFEIGDDYFGIDLLQRTYLTLSEVDILKCRGADIMICPANRAVYSTEVNSCALSLYNQSLQARELCKRTVINRPAPAKLERHGSVVLYYLTEPQPLHLQCQHNRSWEAYNMTLEGGGFLENAESCYLALQGLELYPALRGETEFSAPVPVLFIPTVPAVASAHELEVLRQISIYNGTSLEQLSTSISSHHIEADINTLLLLHASRVQNESKSDWIASGLIAAGVVLTLFILYYFTHSCLCNLVKKCIVDRAKPADDGAQKPKAENPSPLLQKHTRADC